MVIDLRKNPVPGVELAGVKLRSNYKDLLNSGSFKEVEVPSKEVGKLSALGCIEVSFDRRNGKVFRVSGLPGYEGKVDGLVGVGAPMPEVFGILPGVYFDEPEGVFRVLGKDGICLEGDLDDPLVEEVDKIFVQAISVYIPELDDELVQEGDW